MKKRISALWAALLAVLLLASCTGTAEKAASPAPPKTFVLGTANVPEGRTLVISILAGDRKTRWDLRRPADRALRANARRNLGTACRWITAQGRKWNRHAGFVYDWEKHPDLSYQAVFPADFCDTEGDYDLCVWKYIARKIPTRTLMKRYGASNAVFMVLVNSPAKNTETSCTRNWYEGMEYPYEMCYMLLREEGEEEPPAAYAHEMLHTFGAVDLYDTTDENLGASKKFVQYIGRHDANDIMYTVYNAKTGESEYSRISNRLTALDAYYIGWTDSCSLVKEWNLLPSQHG